MLTPSRSPPSKPSCCPDFQEFLSQTLHIFPSRFSISTTYVLVGACVCVCVYVHACVRVCNISCNNKFTFKMTTVTLTTCPIPPALSAITLVTTNINFKTHLFPQTFQSSTVNWEISVSHFRVLFFSCIVSVRWAHGWCIFIFAWNSFLSLSLSLSPSPTASLTPLT